MKISKVIIVINQTKAHAVATAKTLRDVLKREGVDEEWLETLPPASRLYQKLSRPSGKAANLIIACGGDGTLLQTAHRFRGSEIPILGINIGYLGFITSVPGNRVRTEMHRILRGDFVISERTALDITIENGRKRLNAWALNDVVITRGDNPHLISVAASVGKRRLTHYRCDGVVVATPTGSTAYSLAAGGPIISPECKVLTVTPICPQALTNRSVVVDATEPVGLKLNHESGPGEVQVDGMKVCNATPESHIEAKASARPVPIAFLPEINYYDILAEKLKWRGDGIKES